jgi:MOSC domain-containing protein YiiM
VEGEARSSWRGRVVSVHVAPRAGEPPVALAEARAVPGRGLEGDRYFLGTGFYSDKPGPDRELTLVEIETVEALRRDHGIAVEPAELRRNLVTEGVPLNHLVGRTFLVGEALVEGVRLCEPCLHLVEVTGRRQLLSALVHRGGLRARILAGGLIRAGDAVLPVDPAVAVSATAAARTQERRRSPAGS